MKLSPLLFCLASCALESIPTLVPTPTTQPDAFLFQPQSEEPVSLPEKPKGRWVAGDLHCHVSPPDDPGRITISVSGVVGLAKEKGLSFVILVPHLWGGEWRGSRHDFLRKYKKFSRVARQQEEVLLIPGVEYGVGLGHFNLSGFDLSLAASQSNLLTAARDANAFIVVNHPLATNVSGFDMSYLPWTNGQEGFSSFDAVEIWNARLDGESPNKERAEVEEALVAEADQFARELKRRLSLVGGSDNHSSLLLATTWVYTTELTEEAILQALREGRTCVGGPEAGSFTAHGDLDNPDEWVPIGGTVHAQQEVTLHFDGAAQVIVDGESQGIFTDTFVAKADPLPHTYQIVIGPSRSGFIYANF